MNYEIEISLPKFCNALKHSWGFLYWVGASSNFLADREFREKIILDVYKHVKSQTRDLKQRG